MITVDRLVSARVETCSLCQLSCPLCPRFRGETDPVVGKGRLPAQDFRRFLDNNPEIHHVELGNFGEVFLNPHLPEILQIAHQRGVTASIDEGANLNTASDQALEALVRYQVEVVRCAIDGATQQSYERYRAGGRLKNVLDNVRKINAYKEKYGSTRPRLIFQFVIFGHNEHEIIQAGLLAKMLNMEMAYKLNFYPSMMPVQDREKVRRLLGYADRHEYMQQEQKHYMRAQCYEMWFNPQVNWDGKLLGCSRNFWGDYAANAFEGRLLEHVNNEKMRYARAMLTGQQPERADIPCVHCGVYRSMRTYNQWITSQELAEANTSRRPIDPSSTGAVC
jgi:MoaA/NifB/PqqE/SkfB family radical SAM enzyme